MSTLCSKINDDLKNIWRYASFYPAIKKENQLTLGEGNTAEIFAPELAKEFGFKELIFKREDLNPNGSHKDRLLAYQASAAKENGEKTLIISSSGNAAVSASAYCQLAGIKLFVFVSPHTDKEKLKKIADFGAAVIISRRALTLADLVSKKFGIRNLRPGTDKNSHFGLKSIAFEIFEHCGEIDSIFIPTSSASTLIAIGEAYRDLIKLYEIRRAPEIYAVQTSKIHPIAEKFDKDFIPEKTSLARGIISKKIYEKKLSEIFEIIKNSKGGGAVVSNLEIITAQKILAQNNIITSYESAASFAGAIKLKEKISGKKVALLLTGKKTGDIITGVENSKFLKADNIEEAILIIKNSVMIANSP